MFAVTDRLGAWHVQSGMSGDCDERPQQFNDFFVRDLTLGFTIQVESVVAVRSHI